MPECLTPTNMQSHSWPAAWNGGRCILMCQCTLCPLCGVQYIVDMSMLNGSCIVTSSCYCCVFTTVHHHQSLLLCRSCLVAIKPTSPVSTGCVSAQCSCSNTYSRALCCSNSLSTCRNPAFSPALCSFPTTPYGSINSISGLTSTKPRKSITTCFCAHKRYGHITDKPTFSATYPCPGDCFSLSTHTSNRLITACVWACIYASECPNTTGILCCSLSKSWSTKH